jgi:hypothetical protein
MPTLDVTNRPSHAEPAWRLTDLRLRALALAQAAERLGLRSGDRTAFVDRNPAASVPVSVPILPAVNAMNTLRSFQRREHVMGSTRTTRYDAYKAVRGLVEELRDVKLFDAEADSILWAAEGLLLANSATDAEAVEARTTFDTLMQGLAAKRWQDNGPTTAALQRKRLVQAFAECAPLETVPASA